MVDLKKIILDSIEMSFKFDMSIDEKISLINELRLAIHKHSPFKDEPIDLVVWEKSDHVVANDYNPNKVAPPEMELLEISILNDGYTQPIVTWENEKNLEVVDGFHRTRVGKESSVINKRILNYLPVVKIRNDRADKNNRIASTIRHNRARGKHQVSAMSEIVIELKNRNWSNERISKQLGMDEEEVLRLCQISGLEGLFSDNDFSTAWESSDYIDGEFEELTDQLDNDELSKHKIPNEKDDERIFHTYDKWECFRAGFYENKKDGMTDEECEFEYVRILTDSVLFSNTLNDIAQNWPHSCEHYLTNKSMNRIAWLGQAAVCYVSGVPSRYSYAWEKLTDEQKNEANRVAYEFLNKWLKSNGLDTVDFEEAILIDRQVELY